MWPALSDCSGLGLANRPRTLQHANPGILHSIYRRVLNTASKFMDHHTPLRPTVDIYFGTGLWKGCADLWTSARRVLVAILRGLDTN